jgi:hypothetical protein
LQTVVLCPIFVVLLKNNVGGPPVRATTSFLMTASANNPRKAGQLASDKKIFGQNSRYAVAAVHTRFDAVQWFVWDAERLDELDIPSVIRQEETYDNAVAGLV